MTNDISSWAAVQLTILDQNWARAMGLIERLGLAGKEWSADDVCRHIEGNLRQVESLLS